MTPFHFFLRFLLFRKFFLAILKTFAICLYEFSENIVFDVFLLFTKYSSEHSNINFVTGLRMGTCKKKTNKSLPRSAFDQSNIDAAGRAPVLLEWNITICSYYD